MGRTAKPVADEIITEVITDAAEEMNEKDVKKATKQLNDFDEIEVISLIPNISYKDSRTGDFYEWDEIGHIEYMTFDILKNMWRNHKGYFRNMWLKPNDDRVINKFGLTKTFEKYEFLMDKSNYTRKNIDTICETIVNAPNGLKASLYDKVKNLVINGDIADVSIIRKLENRLKIELIDFL
jgi:hypothetical protein